MPAVEPTYPPLNTLKSVTDDVFIVDGPLIHFHVLGLRLPYPTRMTLIRLPDGLFVHSPTPLTPALKQEVDRLGPVRWLVAPNCLHHWWLPEWKAAYDRAEVHLAPRVAEQAKGRIAFESVPIDAKARQPWDGAIATLALAGQAMTEIVFFHRPSRTLVFTDFMMNFEPDKLGFGMRWLTRLGGAADPDGGMPRDIRASFVGRRDALREAIRTMIDWNPERIILSHGRWYERNGADELRRAFRWLRP